MHYNVNVRDPDYYDFMLPLSALYLLVYVQNVVHLFCVIQFTFAVYLNFLFVGEDRRFSRNS